MVVLRGVGIFGGEVLPSYLTETTLYPHDLFPGLAGIPQVAKGGSYFTRH